VWLQEISEYLTTGKLAVQYRHEQKKKLALIALCFLFYLGKIILSRSRSSFEALPIGLGNPHNATGNA
jgi:hypothetical protein